MADYSEMISYKSLSSFDLLMKKQEVEEKIFTLAKCSGADRIIDSLYNCEMAIDNEIATRQATGKINKRTYFMMEEYFRQLDEFEVAQAKEMNEYVRQRAAGLLTEAQLNEKLEEMDKLKEEKKKQLAKSFNKNN